MIIFYHPDMDGICSTAIFVRHYLPQIYALSKTTVMKFEYDKIDEIENFVLKKVPQDVIFLDCCPNKELLKKIYNKKHRIMVFDHHISQKQTFDELYENNFIKGMCYIGASATLIIWCYAYFKGDVEQTELFLDRLKKNKTNQDSEKTIPYSIKLVNSWDIWNGFYVDAEPYKLFFESKNFSPVKDFNSIEELLYNDVEVTKAVRAGHIMKQFFANWGDIYSERYGYEVKYMNYEFFVLNIGNASSKVFGDRICNYDAVITYCNNGEKYICSIYSEKEDFDCSVFAKKFGGGGHKGAAGFTFVNLPIWLRDKKSGLLRKEN